MYSQTKSQHCLSDKNAENFTAEISLYGSNLSRRMNDAEPKVSYQCNSSVKRWFSGCNNPCNNMNS